MTAASEAGMNAITHVGRGTAWVSRDGAGTVQVRVADQGGGIDMENLPRATLSRGFSTQGSLGHGLKMMLETADRLHLLTGPTGTTVVLEQERERPLPSWL
jgi:anti-sigma regulatory factor (Ser/Thr protein kinase)